MKCKNIELGVKAALKCQHKISFQVGGKDTIIECIEFCEQQEILPGVGNAGGPKGVSCLCRF